MEDKDDDIDVIYEENDTDNIETNKITRQKLVYNVTLKYLSLNEMIRVIGVRVDDIEAGSHAFIQVDGKETNTWKIAILELIAGKCPLTVIRSLGFEGNIEIIEIVNVNELILMPKCIAYISDIIKGDVDIIDIKSRLNELIN